MHEYNDKDSEIVEINRTRMLAQIEASKAHDNSRSVSRLSTMYWVSGGYDGLVFPMVTNVPSVDLYDSELDKVYSNIYFVYWKQQKYKRDYEFYHFWCDFYNKRFCHNDKSLSKHIERLLGDMAVSCYAMNNKDERLNGLAYDLAIWNKGYLLRSDQQVAKVLLEAGNATIA